MYQGCLDPDAFNYNPAFDISCNDCCIPSVIGCMNPNSYNYDSLANQPGFCIEVIIGCTDESALIIIQMQTLQIKVTLSYFRVNGCTNSEASNYDPEANSNDGSCQFVSKVVLMNLL